MIFFVKVFSSNTFKIFALVIVSGKPPFLVIITAHPLAEASKLVRPKGSSHLEHATAILVFLKICRTLSWFKKPSMCAFGCFNKIFSLFSSPIIFAFQLGYSFKIFFIDLVKIS